MLGVVAVNLFRHDTTHLGRNASNVISVEFSFHQTNLSFTHIESLKAGDIETQTFAVGSRGGIFLVKNIYLKIIIDT